MTTILVLEDDPSSGFILKSILEEEYRVILTDSPEEAVQVCDSEVLVLFISDNQLRTSVSGLQTLQHVHPNHPHLPLLITSGTPPEGWTDIDFDCFKTLVNSARIGFLPKPFNTDDFRRATCDLMNGTTGSSEIQKVYSDAVIFRSRSQSRAAANE